VTFSNRRAPYSGAALQRPGVLGSLSLLSIATPGIGRALKAAIIDQARRLKCRSLLARGAEGSAASLRQNSIFILFPINV
jgi:hypothetical protein